MHIVLGALALIVTALIVLNRLADAGIDLGGLNPFLWRRRRAWRNKLEGNPLFHLTDPQEVAAVLAVGVAKIDGDMSADEKRALLREFGTTFGLGSRQAAELLGSSVYLLGDPKVLLEQLDSVLQGSADKFTSDQVVSSLAMLERVASSAGAPSGTQRGLIEAIRSRLSQMRPAAKSWP